MKWLSNCLSNDYLGALLMQELHHLNAGITLSLRCEQKAGGLLFVLCIDVSLHVSTKNLTISRCPF